MEKLKTLKKLTILSIILFSILLINSDKVLAYDYDYENDEPIMSYEDGTKKVDLYYIEEENRLFFHRNLGGDDSEYNNKTLSLTTYPYMYCTNYNGIYCIFGTAEFKKYILSTKEAFEFLEGSEAWYYNFTPTNSKAIYQKFNIPGSINVKGNTNEFYSISTFDIIDKASGEIYFKKSDIFNTKKFEYEISEGTNQGKRLVLYFKRFSSTDYAYIYNYQTGKKILLDNLELKTTMTFDDIALDNTYQINIYNGNNELIQDETININQELYISEDSFILIRNLNVKELNSYTANYFNTKDTDKCFYKYKNEEEKELNCNSQTAMITSPNKNTYVEHYIKDKNNNIIVRKNVNLNYLTNLPLFKFKSYFDEKNSVQVLEIITENLQESDIISYSYDNENFYTLETKRINYLNFYNSSNVYLKLERNSEIIAESYFDVVYNSYINSSNNNNLENTNFSFKNLLNNFKNMTNNDFETLKIGTDVYNQLKNSKLGLYFSIIITGSFIILIVKALKR